MKTLLLNADYTPMDVIGWQRAMKMSLGEESVAVLEFYPKSIRDTAGRVYMLPAVIILKKYVKLDNSKATYNKLNVFARDRFICQYCGNQFARKDLTVDHVIPKSKWKQLGHKGTSSCFENVVTACHKCNSKKRDRTPKEANMVLLNLPKKMNRMQSFLNKLALIRDIPEKWKTYLESFLNV